MACQQPKNRLLQRQGMRRRALASATRRQHVSQACAVLVDEFLGQDLVEVEQPQERDLGVVGGAITSATDEMEFTRGHRRPARPSFARCHAVRRVRAGVQGREHVLFAAEYLDNLEEIVKECEVLSSATIVVREPQSHVKDEWVSARQTIIPCDLNTFWAPEIARRADAYIVDSTDEHDLFVEMGYYPGGSATITAETGEVLAGLKEGRTSPDQLIVNSNIGMALCDMAVAAEIRGVALIAGVGVTLEL